MVPLIQWCERIPYGLIVSVQPPRLSSSSRFQHPAFFSAGCVYGTHVGSA